jgi:hypothetical protein
LTTTPHNEAAQARHAASGEQGRWEQYTPEWLSQLLESETPGRDNRNFRRCVRIAWWDAQETGRDAVVAYSTPQQRVVMERVAEMSRGKT